MSKLYEVRQGPEENPSAFYERLCEVARKWMDLNPDGFKSEDVQYVVYWAVDLGYKEKVAES